MRNRIFNWFMVHLYIFSLAGLVFLLFWGMNYYQLPLLERPHDTLHLLLKPGGLWGHGYGMIGSAMILLLFLYSLRKRNFIGLRFGKIRNWLNVHIFFGIIGPLIITLHTAGKFHGLVSISYFSMMSVMISGFIGRYIYIQIPRGEEGHRLAIEEIDQKSHEITNLLVGEYKIPAGVISKINNLSESKFRQKRTGLKAILAIIGDDFARPFRFVKLKRFILNDDSEIPPKAVRQIIYFSKQKALLYRRKAYLGTVSNVLHYWHVIHKPFAWVMILIMLIHVTVVVLMGYKWIF
ncbi:MAG: DUF3810 domain-containing protein [candidate division Zixibacteria bacterium]|nr:DUF3810 domain-containing protein [candidate division Zixibacteria bacterium]